MKMEWVPQEVLQAVNKLDLNISTPAVPEIEGLLGKTVLFRGKKLRPILCFLMGKFFKIPLERIAPYARAAEFVHAATLAHDDVIDESSKRRNRPTINARSSNARAVLAGDLLLSRVMVELSSLGNVQIIHELALTIEELVQGEWLQLEARRVVSVNRQHLEIVSKQKTGSLMSWCCETPPSLLGLSEKVIEAAKLYGEYLGVAFQMIDDVIDYDRQGEKPFAQDVREGLVNFVTFEMLDYRPSLKEPLQSILGKVPEFIVWPWKDEELNQACQRVRARAEAKLEAANQMLITLSQEFPERDETAFQALQTILTYLKERAR